MNDAEAQLASALDAMEHHQRNVTYPLLYDLGDRLAVLGSGVLFNHRDRYFVITAAHLFDDDEDIGKLDESKFAGPNTRQRGTPTTLGPFTLYKDERVPYDFDIAAIELKDPGKIASIKAEWRFLTVRDLATPSTEPLFCLGGYPKDLQSQRGRTTHGPMLVVRTLKLSGTPDGAKEPVNLDYDFFGGYDAHGLVRQAGDTALPSPALRGVSGGSLFQYNDNTTGLWSPDNAMKLVGIQSSASDLKKWFRAKKCNVIAHLFLQIDTEIARAIAESLG